MGPGAGLLITDPGVMEGDVGVMVVIMGVVGILGVVMAVVMVVVVVGMDVERMAGVVTLVVDMEGVVVDIAMEAMVDIIINNNMPPLHLTSSPTTHLPTGNPLQPFMSLMYSPPPSVLSVFTNF